MAIVNCIERKEYLYSPMHKQSSVGVCWFVRRADGPVPPICSMKARRQSVILDVIQREPVRSQEQLRRRVRAAGFDVTQATLSRDIRELGLVKGGADGAYQAPAQAPANGQTARSLLQRALAEYLTRVDRVQQMVLLRTGTGTGAAARRGDRPRAPPRGRRHHCRRRHDSRHRARRAPRTGAGQTARRALGRAISHETADRRRLLGRASRPSAAHPVARGSSTAPRS